MRERRSIILSGLAATSTSALSLFPMVGLLVLGLMCRSGLLLVAAAVWYVPAVIVPLSRPKFWRGLRVRTSCRPPDLPEARDLADEQAVDALHRLRWSRREREMVASRLSPDSSMGRDVRLLEAVADLERGSVELVQTVDRIGRMLAASPPAAIKSPDNLPGHLQALARSKGMLGVQLETLVNLIEGIGPWMLQMEADAQLLRVAELRGSIDTVAAFLGADRTSDQQPPLAPGRCRHTL